MSAPKGAGVKPSSQGYNQLVLDDEGHERRGTDVIRAIIKDLFSKQYKEVASEAKLKTFTAVKKYHKCGGNYFRLRRTFHKWRSLVRRGCHTRLSISCSRGWLWDIHPPYHHTHRMSNRIEHLLRITLKYQTEHRLEEAS